MSEFHMGRRWPVARVLVLLWLSGASFSLSAQFLDGTFKAFALSGELRQMDRGVTGHAITLDAAGDVYVTGEFQGTVDFDPGPGTFNLTSSGSSDVFVAKYDGATGALDPKFKAIHFGGTGFDQPDAIAIEPAGNVYVTGLFSGTADFDPGPGVFIQTGTLFIAKYDGATGGLDAGFKAIGIGGTFTGSPRSTTRIALDGLSGVYLTRDFNGTVDLDPGPGTFNLTSAGNADVFVAKYDGATGALDSSFSAFRIGAANSDIGLAIVLDDRGDLYVLGNFSATVDFDPGPGTFNLTSAAGGSNGFIAKYDGATGALDAAFKAIGLGVGRAIALDGSGDVYVTGFFSGTADFDPGPGTFNLTSGGVGIGFIAKYNGATGALDPKFKAIQFGGVSSAIGLDIPGDVYVTGYFQGTADFDPGPGTFNLTSAGFLGFQDVFIAKYNGATGALDDTFHPIGFGGNAGDEGLSVAVAGSGDVYVTGFFNDTVDFDPGGGIFDLSAGDVRDAFVAKYTAAPEPVDAPIHRWALMVIVMCLGLATTISRSWRKRTVL